MANKATLTQIAALAATALDDSKMGSLTYTAAFNEISHCLEKIGKQVTIRSQFSPKFSRLDGEFLPFGKTVEEFYVELPAVRAYDPSGANALTPAYPVFAPASWSYDIGKKTVKITQARDRVESSCNSAEAFGMMVASIMQGQEDAITIYKNSLKKDLLGNVALKATKAQGSESSSYATSHAYKAGDFVNNGTVYGVVAENYTSEASGTFAGDVANGKIITLDLVKTLAQPSDTATGEAFIEDIKKSAEEATDATEGRCLNGVALETPSLVLYVKNGILPNLDVQTLAGAFNSDKLAMPVTIEHIDSFGGDCPANVYAILMDSRGAALMPNHDTADSDKNGEGEFTNFYRHVGYTAFISRNTFIKVYKKP